MMPVVSSWANYFRVNHVHFQARACAFMGYDLVPLIQTPFAQVLRRDIKALSWGFSQKDQSSVYAPPSCSIQVTSMSKNCIHCSEYFILGAALNLPAPIREYIIICWLWFKVLQYIVLHSHAQLIVANLDNSGYSRMLGPKAVPPVHCFEIPIFLNYN